MVSDRIVMDQKKTHQSAGDRGMLLSTAARACVLLPGTTAWGQNRDFHEAVSIPALNLGRNILPQEVLPGHTDGLLESALPHWCLYSVTSTGKKFLYTANCVHLEHWFQGNPLTNKDALLSPSSPELCCQAWTLLDGQTQKLKSSGSSHESSWTSPLGYSCSQSRRAEYTGEKLIAVDRKGQREWLCTFLGHWSASTWYTRSSHGSAFPAASKLMKRGMQGPNCVFQGKLEAGNKKV